MLRTVLLGLLGGVYALLVLSIALFAEVYDPAEAMLIIGAMLSGMWILQWSVFAGEARPHVRSSIGLVTLLALAFGCIDAVLVAGWNVFAMSVLGWIGQQGQSEWMGFFLLVGFIFGVAMVAYTGWRLPRYDFLALMLMLHLIGGACQGAMLFIPIRYRAILIDGYLDTSVSEILSGVSILATVAVLWWGIAPISYLIAYAGYRKRLHLFANEPAEEQK